MTANGNGNGWGRILAESAIIATLTVSIYVVLSERIDVNRDNIVALDVRLKAEMRDLDDNIIKTAIATNGRVDERFATLDNTLDDSIYLRLGRLEEAVDKLREYMQSLEIRTVKQEPVLTHEMK